MTTPNDELKSPIGRLIHSEESNRDPMAFSEFGEDVESQLDSQFLDLDTSFLTAASTSFDAAGSNVQSTSRPKYDDFETIDWVKYDALSRKHQNYRKRQRRVSEVGQTRAQAILRKSISLIAAAESWFLVAGTGILVGCVSSAMDISTRWLSDLKLGHCDYWYLNKEFCCSDVPPGEICTAWKKWAWSIPYLDIFNYLFFVVIAVLLSSASAFLVIHQAPYAGGSGIAEIKTVLGGFIMHGFLGFKTFIVKVVGLPLAVASGLCVGKEGPTLHVAAAICNLFMQICPGQVVKNEAKKREILSAACSAGVCVAFGAPLGGVIFALEELSSFFSIKTLWQSFLCTLLASITVQFVNPNHSSRLVLFATTYDRPWHLFELLFFVALGIVGGVLGAFVIHFNIKLQSLRRKSPTKSLFRQTPLQEVVLLALVTAALGYFNSFMRMDQTELLGYLFSECREGNRDELDLCLQHGTFAPLTFFSLLIALVLKMTGTIFCFGARVPGGIFIPSMVIGACFGRLLGMGIQTVYMTYRDHPFFASCGQSHTCITPGAYGLLGAMALLTGVTRMTLSIAIIMFELTGTLSYIIPCMITLTISKMVGEFIVPESINEAASRLADLPYLDHKVDVALTLTDIPGIIAATMLATPAKSLVCLWSGMTLGQMIPLIQDNAFSGYPIIEGPGDFRYVGFIERKELLYRLEKMLHGLNVTRQVDGTEWWTDTLVLFHDDKRRQSTESAWSPHSPSIDKGVSSPDSSDVHDGEPTSHVLHLGKYMEKTPIFVHPKSSIQLLTDIFQRMGPRYLILKETGRLVGIVTKKDILHFLWGLQENGTPQQLLSDMSHRPPQTSRHYHEGDNVCSPDPYIPISPQIGGQKPELLNLRVWRSTELMNATSDTAPHAASGYKENVRPSSRKNA